VPRPFAPRRIGYLPGATYFKPAGVPMRALEEVTLTLDEFEAVRLADLEGLYQEQAAEQMQVSRQTFGRIVDSAHRKVAEALVHGKALRVHGGPALAVGAPAWGGGPGYGRGRRCGRGRGRGRGGWGETE
jgi:predicted DNA-binding protein (UPF0251 family)